MDSGGNSDWGNDATMPPSGAEPEPRCAMFELPDWGDSVLTAVERVEAAAAPGQYPKLPTRQKITDDSVRDLFLANLAEQRKPTPPEDRTPTAVPSTARGEAEAFFAAARRDAASSGLRGAAVDVSAEQMIDMESGLYRLESGLMQLESGLMNIDSGLYDLSAGGFDLSNGELGLLSGAFDVPCAEDVAQLSESALQAAPNRLTDILAAIEADDDFGKLATAEAASVPEAAVVPKPPPLPPSQRTVHPVSRALAGNTHGGPVVVPVVEARSDEPRRALTGSRYAARSVRTTESIAVVSVKRPTRD